MFVRVNLLASEMDTLLELMSDLLARRAQLRRAMSRTFDVSDGDGLSLQNNPLRYYARAAVPFIKTTLEDLDRRVSYVERSMRTCLQNLVVCRDQVLQCSEQNLAVAQQLETYVAADNLGFEKRLIGGVQEALARRLDALLRLNGLQMQTGGEDEILDIFTPSFSDFVSSLVCNEDGKVSLTEDFLKRDVIEKETVPSTEVDDRVVRIKEGTCTTTVAPKEGDNVSKESSVNNMQSILIPSGRTLKISHEPEEESTVSIRSSSEQYSSSEKLDREDDSTPIEAPQNKPLPEDKEKKSVLCDDSIPSIHLEGTEVSQNFSKNSSVGTKRKLCEDNDSPDAKVHAREGLEAVKEVAIEAIPASTQFSEKDRESLASNTIESLASNA